ncbi:Cullin-2 [Dinochytrium kinnereticum]|nr:Cullin-2 [Dinochytrium kinnereticum]
MADRMEGINVGSGAFDPPSSSCDTRLVKNVVEAKGMFMSIQKLENIYASVGQRSYGIDPYQQVYDLCTAYPKPYDDVLFDFITDFLINWVILIAERILRNEDVVSEYVKEWEKFQIATGYVDKICDYLNRLIFKKKNPHRRSTPAKSYKKQRIESVKAPDSYRNLVKLKLAFTIWKDLIIDGIKFKHSNRLQRQIMDLVKRDRDVNLFVHNDDQLQLYVDYFETPYLLSTKEYYTSESSYLIGTVDISTYMEKITTRLKEEQARSIRYCDPSSIEKIIKEFEHQCIKVHMTRMHQEFEKMVANEKYRDCSLAYKLLNRVIDGVQPLLKTLEAYVARVGNGALANLNAMNSKEPKDFVDPLIELHSKYIDVCQKYFDNDPSFTASIDKGFKSIINAHPPSSLGASSSEVLAKYCDWLLKKTSKSQWSESDIETRLNRLVILFKYVDDKDVFQKFYSRLLAKRLIFASSVSDDAESNMITRLKNACGFEYTAKLQRMFTDMALSGDVNRHFTSDLAKKGTPLSIDFSILVLTAGSWPLVNNVVFDVQLPSELEQAVSEFSKFYVSLHNGRRIADVRVNFADRRYELNVSLHQLCLLRYFNDADAYDYSELMKLMRLSDAELRRVLKPLFDIKILEFEPKSGESISNVSLNLKFSSKRTKIKVSASLQLESSQEAASTRKAVEDDRRFFVEAIIVRIMKSRKKIDHAMLIQDTIDHSKSRFTPSVTLVKKSIEGLIEKGYLARNAVQNAHLLLQKQLTHTILLHPQYFGARMNEFLVKRLYEEVEGTCSGRFGYIISVVEVTSVGRGVLQSTSGYAEFSIVYKAIVFKPFKNQVVDGVVTTVNKLIPSYLKFDPNSNPPAYLGEGQEVQDTRIEKGETVRMRIVGTRVDATEIVCHLLVIDSVLYIVQFAIGTIKEDFLGPSQG